MKRFMGAGALAGWIGTSFLLGILAHSLWPYAIIPMAVFAVGLGAGVAVLAFGWVRPWVRVGGLCLIALVIGLWRFDIARPTMPSSLRPFSPKNLAFQKTDLVLGETGTVSHALGRVRVFLSDRSRRLFAPDEAALLNGILYGERNLSATAKEQFRRAGLLHIIAVSGSNMTILAVLAMRSLLILPLRRRSAFALFSVLLFGYVLFVGFSASVVRAAIMGWLIELAPIIGRLPRATRLLLVSAVVFSWWKPWALLYDAGFALSFLAMAGLLTWGTWIAEKMERVLKNRGLREILSATVGATIMTAPYTAWAFGQVSALGLLSSVFVLPLVPWTMILGTVSLLIPVPYLLTVPTAGFLKMILLIAELVNRVPFGYWRWSIPFWALVAIYGALWLIWGELQAKKHVIHRKKGVLSISS